MPIGHSVGQPAPPRSSFTRLRDLPALLKTFVRDPIEAMKTPIRLNWVAVVVLQIGSALITGALAGVLAKNLWDFFVGLMLFPITSLAIGFVYTGFLFGYFSLFKSTYLDFRRLHSIVVVTLIPYFFVHIFAGFIAPMDLLGFALTAILLVVGLTEQFGLPRKDVAKVVGGLSLLFFLVWMAAQIRAADTLSGRY